MRKLPDERPSQTHANGNEDAELKTSDRGESYRLFLEFVSCFVETRVSRNFFPTRRMSA
jgi:hypothetical protein